MRCLSLSSLPNLSLLSFVTLSSVYSWVRLNSLPLFIWIWLSRDWWIERLLSHSRFGINPLEQWFKVLYLERPWAKNSLSYAYWLGRAEVMIRAHAPLLCELWYIWFGSRQHLLASKYLVIDIKWFLIVNQTIFSSCWSAQKCGTNIRSNCVTNEIDQACDSVIGHTCMSTSISIPK